ncbi:MAG: methyltransferase [Gemmatimonas sp.]|uniref:methyltransferase n=1 Tax=Gemmatimonas sp. TaxID=1962908 RepID=UPI00391F8A78|nr:acetylserotonin O-methyltransferase [Gemmatimonadota bacterium]
MNPPEQALPAPPVPAAERLRTPAAIDAVPAAPATVTPAPTWLERMRDRWNALVATDDFQRWSARFPLTRPITMYRSRKLFDIVSGFVYTQTLLACVELDLFEFLADGARTADEIATHTGLSRASTERLVNAAVSLRLLVRRRHGRFAVGPLGAPLVRNTGVLALIRHHRMAYHDLSDPVSLLRQGADYRTELSRYWSYADAPRPQAIDDTRVAAYSEIMAATLPPVAHDVLDAYDLSKHESLLDVGGGEGAFLSLVGARHPRLQLQLFDLPAVAARARTRLEQAGLGDRVTCHGGNFHADSLPGGADVCSLVRVLLDHDDASVLRLLQRVRAALPRGGVLLIAEALAGAKGAETVGDAYFSFYLMAMGKGRARRASELHQLLQSAGFRRSRELPTRFPIQTGLIVAEV